MPRFLFPLLALALAAPASANERVHVVGPGDSLSAIAVHYGVRVDDLRAWNGIEGDAIQVGQSLTVAPVALDDYRVRSGDTLSCIAQRTGTTIERLRADNPPLARGLEAGMTLRVPRIEDRAAVSAPRTYRVRAGDNLHRIARRHGRSVAELIAINPGLSAARLREGVELVVGTNVLSESLGHPMCGSIQGSVMIGDHPAYVLRDRRRAFATERTVARIRRAFDAVHRAEPDGPRVRVHDLSLEGGGPIDDHRSHQSGRDVDITYYRAHGCAPAGCPLRPVDPDHLDVRRTWRLLRHWITRGEAHEIYVDYELQAPLYREAQRLGATEAELAAWFQYPRGADDTRGIVQHLPNHRDHLHVRFTCDPSETRCDR